MIEWVPDALAAGVAALAAVYREASVAQTVDEIIDETIGVEGAYSNHPADRGGPTKWGITQQTARAFGYAGRMDELRREEAKRIYRARYWSAPRFDTIAAVSLSIATEMFDTGVNMGPAIAGRFLQRALNGLNREAGDYADIAVDGNVGPMTVAALRAFLGKRPKGGERVILRALNAQQATRYLEIVEARPSQETFLYGWLDNRVTM